MCSKPLKGFEYGVTKNGKPNYIVTSSNVDHVEISKSGAVTYCYDSFISDNCKSFIGKYIEIPCGQCLECRLEYSRQWANRCILEAKDHKENCFVTLTYDDLNVPVVDDVDPETGEIVKFKTLVKEDLQKFIKRLRKRLPEDVKIRYFAAGEYGDQTYRPHYHLIIFGWKPPEEDLHLIKMSNLGYAYYYSDFLKEVWPFGNNLVADCSWETCAYVARYVVKKYKREKNIFSETKILPEFVTMSRKPGIGLNWLLSHDVCYATFLNQYISTPNGSRELSSNRYFDSYIEKLDPEAYESMKKVREHFQKEKKKLEYFQSDLPYLERLKVKERNLVNRTKVLERKAI